MFRFVVYFYDDFKRADVEKQGPSRLFMSRDHIKHYAQVSRASADRLMRLADNSVIQLQVNWE